MIFDVEWSNYFLDIAGVAATKSKDPSTKVGAVLVRPDKTIASVGFNGFPRRIYDCPTLLNERKEKYKRTIHAEMNTILNCRDQSMNGYHMFLEPLLPCEHCTIHIIQAGIISICVRDLQVCKEHPRWGSGQQASLDLLEEAGVLVYDAVEKEIECDLPF